MILFVGKKGDRTNRYACMRINQDVYACGMCKAEITAKQVEVGHPCHGCGGILTVVKNDDVQADATTDRRPQD